MARNVKTNSVPYADLVDYDPRRDREREMDKLARKYVETHDPEIIEALY
jgi:hypothetical protein